MLIMYAITALLFMTSFELHVHTHEAAPAAEHGKVTLVDGPVQIIRESASMICCSQHAVEDSGAL